MEFLLQILLLTAILSILINVFFKKFDIPPIIGYIFAGVFITSVFSLRETNLHTLHDISEFGIAFLMFTIGLEFSVENFKKLKKEVFVFGFLQVGISSVIFALLAHYGFSLGFKTSIVIGAALALSSTAIVLKILNESREVKKEYGRSVVGILIFQDLAVIPMILMISFLSDESLDMGMVIAKTAGELALLFVLLYLAGKYVITFFLKLVFDIHSHELFIASVLVVAVSVSYAAYYFGFSYSLGAFIGGMLLAETPFKHQVQADLTPFRDLLLGVFFVTVGMQVNYHFFFTNILQIFVLMVLIMLLKTVIIGVILRFFSSTSNALKSALALSQVGEFSFVVLELSRINGIVSKDITQLLIIAVVFSMILTPFIVKHLQTIVDKLLRLKQPNPEKFSSAGIEGHIVVIGYGSLGQWVCKKIKERGLYYIAIDNKRKFFDISRENKDPFILGNANQEHILYDANISRAMAVVITVEKDDETVGLVESVLHLSPCKNIVVSTREMNSLLFEDQRIRSVIYEHKEVSEKMVIDAITCKVV